MLLFAHDVAGIQLLDPALHLLTKPFVVSNRFVGTLHRRSTILTSTRSFELLRVIVHRVHVKTRDADFFDVIHDRFQAAIGSHLTTTSSQGPFCLAILHHDAPARRLTDDRGRPYSTGFHEAGEGGVIDGVRGP